VAPFLGIGPWWNKELSHLKASTRQIFNRDKRTGGWESYKMVLTCYNKDMCKDNDPLGGTTVRGIEDVPKKARLMRITASQLANRDG
jgi:hypothetical protein